MQLDSAGIKRYTHSRYYDNQAVLIGLRIVLTGDQRTNPTRYLEKYLYGDDPQGVASSGFFHYLPLSSEHFNEDFFLSASSGEIGELLKAIYAQRVTMIDGNTQVEIMVLAEAFETFDDEIQAINSELNEFVELGYAVRWEQINLCTTEEPVS